MTLNASGPISIAGTTTGESIQIELGGTGTTQMGLNCCTVRTLAGVPSGAIVMPTCFYGKSNTPPFNCVTYGTAGTYTFTVPSGVSKISCVVVGSGGLGNQNGYGGPGVKGGGGGALSFTNCIPTTPGESLTVIVGAGLTNASAPYPCSASGLRGNNSSLKRGCTILVEAMGGRAGGNASVCTGGNASGGTGAVKYSGGSTTTTGNTRSAGGAAGYAGDGGNGSTTIGSAGSSGAGGGGGGGGKLPTGRIYQSGGGVGIIVQGCSGAGGSATLAMY